MERRVLGEEGMFSESCHDLGGALGWINLTADIREGEVVVFRVVIKGEPGVGKPEKLMSFGPVDKRTILNAPN